HSLGERVEPYLVNKGVRHRRKAYSIAIVEVLLTLGRIDLKGIDDLLFTRAQVGFADVLLVKRDDNFIPSPGTFSPQMLDAGVVQSRFVQIGTDLLVVGRVSEFYVDQGSTTKIHAQRDPVPEQHGEDAGHAEYEREAEEVPLLAEKIDVGVAKEFHSYSTLRTLELGLNAE